MNRIDWRADSCRNLCQPKAEEGQEDQGEQV